MNTPKTTARTAPWPPVEPPERVRRLPSWVLNHVAMRANRVVASHLEHSGRRSDYAVLASLEESGPASQAELARRLAIDRGDLVGLLDRITEEGLARREPDTSDKRRNVITVTPDGRDKLVQLDKEIEAAQEDLLRPLDPDERTLLIDLLWRLLFNPATE
ncbi:MarR family transcriptional regulator [Rhodococcus sp. IEGM 1381]|uniref:MarR family winged helix-turn-helix transcriptional regulator n=1 Tax=Rhodococcus sp. IEGM 1381 TaxID=3047085 RepID=UPI0024B79959|nr:MarR family transcriptional regulator [Rhodococcus sp. IEGM 1381]MDI9896338.1 MarR family transcriptional regulator [Rhodococcus sp. IEGM 1381]